MGTTGGYQLHHSTSTKAILFLVLLASVCLLPQLPLLGWGVSTISKFTSWGRPCGPCPGAICWLSSSWHFLPWWACRGGRGPALHWVLPHWAALFPFILCPLQTQPVLLQSLCPDIQLLSPAHSSFTWASLIWVSLHWHLNTVRKPSCCHPNMVSDIHPVHTALVWSPSSIMTSRTCKAHFTCFHSWRGVQDIRTSATRYYGPIRGHMFPGRKPKYCGLWEMSNPCTVIRDAEALWARFWKNTPRAVSRCRVFIQPGAAPAAQVT